MTTTTKLSFEGVVTLKTQEEADELVQAINTLIDRGVFIYRELEKGTSSDIENSLKAVIRYCPLLASYFLVVVVLTTPFAGSRARSRR